MSATTATVTGLNRSCSASAWWSTTRAQWRRVLQLWPVGRVLSLVFLAAVAVAGGVLWGLVEFLGVHQLKAETQLTSKPFLLPCNIIA
ncbi:hypothetical protein [Streptomyces sp. NPDC102490]|uniref:hypothetical protein n=1 Tax=Streptomyces sp. NPDC102490 TaxID=3366183 RepID=UPI00382D1620